MSLIEKIKNIGGTKTVLFYYNSNFVIEFEGKTFRSELIGNTHCIILNIPYDARFTLGGNFENNSVSVLLEINDDGSTLEGLYNTNNLILPIQRLLGEPQE